MVQDRAVEVLSSRCTAEVKIVDGAVFDGPKAVVLAPVYHGAIRDEYRAKTQQPRAAVVVGMVSDIRYGFVVV
jgi:hypothetical protein